MTLMTPSQPLNSPSAADAAEMQELEERASPFKALYAHWERSQWSALELDLETDRASFAALDAEEQAGLVWIFAHRFHAEFNVARLLAPFCSQRPTTSCSCCSQPRSQTSNRHLQ